MAKRTTGQWQELLDDAEHGPWDFAADYGQVASKYALIAQEVDDHNSPLIAAAPEAVAEVVRLREELEALRRNCIESAEVCDRYAEVAHVPDSYVFVAEAERDTADIITRILDGSES